MSTDEFLRRYRFVRDARQELPRHERRVWVERDVALLDGMVWHQTLGAGDAAAVARYHVGPNHMSPEGLPALSYTFFVESSGVVLLCNAIESTTYSQGDRYRPGDENARYVAVAFAGDFDGPGHRGSMRPTARQLRSGIRLWEAACTTFGWSTDRLFGHADFGKAACPGTVLMSLIASVRTDANPTRWNFRDPTGRQAALQALGFYQGGLDGIWGIESRRALTNYQVSRGLPVDSVWGPVTEAAMRRDVG